MRNRKILILLMILPLVITLVALQYLPDSIPAHYGYDNTVTRWGSKYETLIFPAITVSFGLFMLFMAKVSSKDEKNGQNNEKVCILTGIMSLAVFNIMTLFFLYAAFNKVEDLSTAPADINRLMFASIGMLMIVIGNKMPKLKINSFIGLRTPWSMENEESWRRSQRFGGILFMITGMIIIIISILTKGTECMLFCLAALILSAIISVYGTYKISKNI
ncbi:MAG: DUF1648 domain-containing protein [Anaerofustis stercorihominis]|nr:DUF1648 domain-containing protein [Anaerofustis stercorihominis]